jgi:3-oxoacyl-[acyl-carrier-protein] synthase II
MVQAWAFPEIHVVGMSWTTPLGDDLDDVWHRLVSGEDGLRPWASALALRNDLAALVPAVDPAAPPRERQHRLATTTLLAAFRDAGLPVDQPDVAVVIGTSYGAHLDEEVGSLSRWAVDSAAAIGYPGDPICVSTACSAGADSVAIGAALIAGGCFRVAVCGGVDIVTDAKRLGHSALGTMTAQRLRAFDERHCGMLLGEGAGFVVLQRGPAGSARPYARLRGYGGSNDAAGMTTPDPGGDSVAMAVRRSLHGSGVDLDDVAVVSAHGTGTPLNDAAELLGLRTLFAGLPRFPLVFATKGALGHSLGACGAIEAISVVQALRTGLVPPVCGLEVPMAQAVGVVRPGGPHRFDPRRSDRTAGISVTLGFGGFNTSLVFSG